MQLEIDFDRKQQREIENLLVFIDDDSLFLKWGLSPMTSIEKPVSEIDLNSIRPLKDFRILK
jgi:hypothetical protein